MINLRRFGTSETGQCIYIGLVYEMRRNRFPGDIFTYIEVRLVPIYSRKFLLQYHPSSYLLAL